MSGTAGADPYLDPASGVLRNLLGISDPGELAQVEAALSASRLVDLERRRLPGRYDLDHLRAAGPPCSSPTSTPCTLSGRGTAEPSGRSSPSSPMTPAITSTGCAWTPRNITASAAAHKGDLGPLTGMLNDLIDLPHPPGPGGGHAA